MSAGYAEHFRALIGLEHVIEDATEREYFSTDISGGDAVAELILQPGTVDELAACVRTAANQGFAILARGGGIDDAVGLRDHQLLKYRISLKNI